MLAGFATFATILAIFGIAGRFVADKEPKTGLSAWNSWDFKWRLFYRLLPYTRGTAVVLWVAYLVIRAAPDASDVTPDPPLNLRHYRVQVIATSRLLVSEAPREEEDDPPADEYQQGLGQPTRYDSFARTINDGGHQ